MVGATHNDSAVAEFGRLCNKITLTLYMECQDHPEWSKQHHTMNSTYPNQLN